MWKFIFLTLLLLVTMVGVVFAQTDDCPPVVEETLNSISTICDALGRNTACYGASKVESTTVTQPRPANFFVNPGDYGELAQFREIAPQPLDEINNTFGAAVMNLQANLPNTLPGQGVIFLLVGNARLTNEVAQDSTEQTAFQSFYFLPGVNKPGCYQAEPMLTIQTPGNVEVRITLNGVERVMSPSTLLTITPSVCTIHRGYITSHAGDKTTNLLANQTVDIHIEDNGAIKVDDLRGISQREYERGVEIQTVLNALAKTNDWAEQYIGEAPAFAAEPTAAAATAQPTESACLPYTVVPGDTLRKIATLYGTGMQDIVDANHLANPNLIFAGQQLCIPNAGSGFKPLSGG